MHFFSVATDKTDVPYFGSMRTTLLFVRGRNKKKHLPSISRINAYREVREMRFELIHRNRHYPLKVACLPIPPLAQNVSSFMRSPSKLSSCPRQDSNLHVAKHSHLKRARLPIPPLGLLCYSLLLASGPNEKSRTQSTSILFSSTCSVFRGADGTRTRDPLRDRQVF